MGLRNGGHVARWHAATIDLSSLANTAACPWSSWIRFCISACTACAVVHTLGAIPPPSMSRALAWHINIYLNCPRIFGECLELLLEPPCPKEEVEFSEFRFTKLPPGGGINSRFCEFHRGNKERGEFSKPPC